MNKKEKERLANAIVNRNAEMVIGFSDMAIEFFNKHKCVNIEILGILLQTAITLMDRAGMPFDETKQQIVRMLDIPIQVMDFADKKGDA